MKKKKIIQLMLAFMLLLSLGTPLSISTVEAADDDRTYATIATSRDSLNVRSSPSSSSKVIDSLKKGTIVTVYGYEYEWTLVNYKNTTGYVADEYLDYSINTRYSAKVNTVSDNLSIRSSRSKKNKNNIVGSLKKGASITIYGNDYKGWTTVRYKNKFAYVSADYLKYSATVATISDPLSVRSSKSKANDRNIIGSVKKDATVTVYKRDDNGWATIKYKNKKAYVASEYLYFD